jgi:hypothetical protein
MVRENLPSFIDKEDEDHEDAASKEVTLRVTEFRGGLLLTHRANAGKYVGYIFTSEAFCDKEYSFVCYLVTGKGPDDLIEVFKYDFEFDPFDSRSMFIEESEFLAKYFKESLVSHQL